MPLHPWLIGVGLILLVVGAKLWVVDQAGSSLPYRDQIDAEGESILRPWAEGDLEASAFFAPHNEHRVVFTKLLSWAGVVLNRQWDVQLQLCLNAFLHAGLLLIVLRWVRGYLTGWKYAALAVITAVMWVLPLDWENTLGGFQSQVYLVLAFSFLQIWGMLRAERMDWAWWGGSVCGLLALGAMASGVLSSLAVIAVLGLQAWRHREINPIAIKSLAVATLWIMVAIAGRVSVPGHESLKADSIGRFLEVLAEAATWPGQGLLPWALVATLPAIWVAVRIIRARDFHPPDLVFLGVGGWLALTLVATAWLRGEGSPLISRYLTTYYLWVVLQGLALLWQSKRVWHYGLFTIWAGAVLFGLLSAAGKVTERRLPGIAERATVSERVVRDFLASGDPARLSAVPTTSLPYPSAAVLAERWGHPSIQQLLPAAVRQPIELGPSEPANAPDLPSAIHPIVAASPLGPQTESWVWRSERQPDSDLPILRLQFNGGLGDPETALNLRIVTDEDDFLVIPDGPARQRWKTINIIRPKGEWWLEIEDSDTMDRLAITAPVELGWGSYGAGKMIKFHFWWISSGAILVVLGILDRMRFGPLIRD
jgi:hypothetical protein